MASVHDSGNDAIFGKKMAVYNEEQASCLPLWKVMRAAYSSSTAANGSTDNWTERDGYAAEIRAVRDWLASQLPEVGAHVIRTLLTAEAERAEQSQSYPHPNNK